jgi:hypothetical protein
VRWGLSAVPLLVVVAVVAAQPVLPEASGSNAQTAQAEGAILVLADGTSVGSPVAQAPDGPTSVSAPGWQSSPDAPVVKAVKAWSTVSATDTSASATVYLRDVSAIGGEVTLGRLKANVVQQPTGDPSVSVALRDLVVGGQPVTVEPGQTVTVGDWASISAAVPTDPTDGLGGTIGLRIEITTEHAGLAAGTVILLGLAEVAPPAPPAPPPPPSTGGGGGGTGNGDGGGNGAPGGSGDGASGAGGGTPPPPPPPVTVSGAGTHGWKTPDGGSSHTSATAPKGGKHAHKDVPVPVFTHPTFLPPLGHGVRAAIVRAALDQVGWPYVWGGESRSEGGFDCSGLVDYAYAAAGHQLPGRPTAAVLWHMGIVIRRSQLRPGDLVFLGAPSGDPYHVALYIGRGMVVVAPHRGAMIGEVPLGSVPWDGYARIWSPATGLILGARERPWPTVSAKVVRDALADDQRAAARALQPRTTVSWGYEATPERAAVPAPAPRQPSKRDSQATVVADLRSRFDLRWTRAAASTGRL